MGSEPVTVTGYATLLHAHGGLVAFLLTLLYIFLLYVRPLDLVEGYEDLPVMMWLGLAALAAAVAAWLVTPPSRRASLFDPQPWLTVVFAFLAMLPWAFIGWFDEVILTATQMQSVVGASFMVLLTVQTMNRLRWFVGVLVLAFVIMTAQGFVSYYSGWRHDTFVMDQRVDAEPDEAPTFIYRLRHTGFLNDPNDFAQSLVTLLPLVAVAWRPRKPLANYAVVLPLIGAFFWGVVLTHSRGGLVATAVTTMLALRDRMGRVKASILTGMLVAAFILFNFGAGRAFNDESAENRVEAWASGLLMIRESPLGVGFNGFVEAHPGLTAHNSFVLAFAETGLIGYFVWMALLVITYMELTRLVDLRGADVETAVLRKWARGLRLALSGFLAGAYFLSRTYVVTLYLLITLALCLRQIALRQGHALEPIPATRWMLQTLKWEAITVFSVWLSVKLTG